MMENTAPNTLESLLSLVANEENFSALVSHLQSLNNYWQHNPDPPCQDDYVRLMAHLIENYLDDQQQLFLRQHLVEMIARQTEDDYAAQYFKQRFATAELLDLLQHHLHLTNTRLVLTRVDYNRHKFKLKIYRHHN